MNGWAAWSPARRLGLVTGAALLLRAVALSAQPLIPDDLSVGLTARNFVEHGWPGPTMWNHPRLRDLLVFASTALLGEGAWGLKLWSVLLGTLSVAALGWLLLEVGAGEVAALVAALLVAIDPLHVDFSRQAINDVYLACFPVASAALLWRWRARRHPAWLAAAGLALGLGLASKWSAAFPVAVAAAVVVGTSLLDEPDPRRRRAEGALALAALGVLPLAVYLATFWPWFDRGYGLADLVTFHRFMALETATHVGYAGTKLPGYAGELVGAWRWFVQPIWYIDHVMPVVPDGPRDYVSGVANPLTWLLVWPAAAFAAWRALGRRDRVAGLLLALFLAAYLPLALVPRPIWTNSAVGVWPWAAALLGYGAQALWPARPRLVASWLALAVAAGLFFWLPAAAVSTGPTDAALHALAPPEAFVPRPGEQ